jgi:anti-sigma-K factor RskA
LNITEYISSGAIEAAILGLANNMDQKQYEQMYAQHDEVRTYANQFEIKLEEEYLSNATIEPNKNVFEEILAATKLSPVVAINPIQNQSVTRKNPWKQYAVAASIALLLGSVMFNIILAKRIKTLQSTVTDLAKTNTISSEGIAKLAFLKEPTITPVAMNGVGIHNVCRCSLYWDKAKNKAFLIVHHLFPPGQEKDYRVWAMIDGKPYSIGVLKYNNKKEPIEITNVPQGATEFSVTLEDKGGNITTPTLEELILQGKIST